MERQRGVGGTARIPVSHALRVCEGRDERWECNATVLEKALSLGLASFNVTMWERGSWGVLGAGGCHLPSGQGKEGVDERQEKQTPLAISCRGLAPAGAIDRRDGAGGVSGAGRGRARSS